MFNSSRFAALALVLGVGLAGLVTQPAHANGDIGEHVHNLKAHLDEYSSDVEKLVGQVEGLVDRYEAEGRDAVDTQNLIDWWEAVKIHGAIEVNHVPVYAAIWQGLYGVKQGIEKGKPVAAVRKQQQALEHALWQGLGVVKLAAVQQQKQDKKARKNGKKPGTIGEILDNLDRVVALQKKGSHEQAAELVHSTYANLFEGIEGELIEQDADLVADLEKDFNVTLPKALDPDTPAEKVRGIIAAMKKKLHRADKLLSRARENKKDVF